MSVIILSVPILSTISVIMLRAVMPNVIKLCQMFHCNDWRHHAECRYSKCRLSERRGARGIDTLQTLINEYLGGTQRDILI